MVVSQLTPSTHTSQSTAFQVLYSATSKDQADLEINIKQIINNNFFV